LTRGGLLAGACVLTILQMLDVESGSVAEEVFRKLGYVEFGKVPRYGRSPAGTTKDQTFFYKDLAS